MKKFKNFCKYAVASSIAGLSLGTVQPASAGVVALTGPVTPHYELQLHVKKGLKTVEGTETVSFTNGGTQPLTNIWLRTWANGLGKCKHPAINVNVTSGGKAGQLATNCTALNVQLSQPVAAGEQGQIQLTFTISLPTVKSSKTSDRFGIEAKTGTAMIGNAIPILAVNDQRGIHFNEPYTELGESFYSLSSRWHAQVDLPPNVDGAMTGTTVNQTALPDGGKRVETTSETARDFGLAIGKYTVDETQQDGIKIRYFHPAAKTQKDQRKWKEMLTAAQESIRIFQQQYGRYGSPELDIADSQGAAMEYPEMVMTMPLPVVIAHEIAHQWWFGIVGDDEHYEPWLDESFASYSELDFARNVTQTIKKKYPQFLNYGIEQHTKLFSSQCDPQDPYKLKIRLTDAGRKLPPKISKSIVERNQPPPPKDYFLTNTMTYFDKHPSTYSRVYFGGACSLESLRHDLGGARMQTFLQSYVANHRFEIATTQDFLAELQAFTGNQSLVDQFIKRSRIQVNKP